MESELIKAIPNGGQLVVFLIVVVIFLRQMQTITASFQTQVKDLTDTIFKISQDTSKAVNDLTTAVKALEVMVDQHQRG